MENNVAPQKNILRKLLTLLFGLYLIVLGYVLFVWSTPMGEDTLYRSYNLTPMCEVAAAYMGGNGLVRSQFVLNILLFVPLGFALPLMSPKFAGAFWKTALITLFTTALAETIQYFIGRFADIDDVIANFLGGVAGYSLYTLFLCIFGRMKKWPDFAHSTRRARALPVMLSLLAVAVIFGTPFVLDSLDAKSENGLMRYVSHNIPISAAIECDIPSDSNASAVVYEKRAGMLEASADMLAAAYPPGAETERIDYDSTYYGAGMSIYTQDHNWYLTAYDGGTYNLTIHWPDAPCKGDLEAFSDYVHGMLPALTPEGVELYGILAQDNERHSDDASSEKALSATVSARSTDEAALHVSGNMYVSYYGDVLYVSSGLILATPSGTCRVISAKDALKAARGPGAMNTAYTNVVIEGVELTVRRAGQEFVPCYRFYGTGRAYGSKTVFECYVDAVS